MQWKRISKWKPTSFDCIVCNIHLISIIMFAISNADSFSGVAKNLQQRKYTFEKHTDTYTHRQPFYENKILFLNIFLNV